MQLSFNPCLQHLLGLLLAPQVRVAAEFGKSSLKQENNQIAREHPLFLLGREVHSRERNSIG